MAELTANILFSCYEERKRESEQFVSEHALICVLDGELLFHLAGGARSYGPGQIELVRKNQLIKTQKLPPATGGSLRCINIALSQDALRRYATTHDITPAGPYQGATLVELSPNPILSGYFESLLPYLTSTVQLSGALAELKTTEAIELLLRFRPELREFLFDFSEPFKIDLEAFMHQNYTFNVPLSKFARLTGRSLATFKRDFQKTFGSAPQKWLLTKRLELAHFLLAERRQKPSNVYLEVGFENFSHFSSSFRQLFGYPPSKLGEPLATATLSL